VLENAHHLFGRGERRDVVTAVVVVTLMSRLSLTVGSRLLVMGSRFMAESGDRRLR
jgi:hypothetical protein